MKGQLIDPHDLVPTLPSDEPIVVVFGAMARGFLELDYVRRSPSDWSGLN